MRKLAIAAFLAGAILVPQAEVYAVPAFSLSDDSVAQGGQARVTFSLVGGDRPYAAANFVIELPEGITLTSFAGGADLPDGFSVDVNQFTDGAQTFVAGVLYSPLGLGSFTGDAALVTLVFDVAGTAPAGERPLFFADGMTGLSNADGSDSVIHLALAGAVSVSDASDTDGDGLLDTWEIEHFGNLNQSGSADPDGDTLTNLGEFTNNSDPNDPDSDDDGFSDRTEFEAETDPNDPNDFPTTGGGGVREGEGEGEGDGVGEGEGEGEGEGGLGPITCATFASLSAQLDSFRTVFGISGTDLDADGFPDNASMELMRVVTCSNDGSALWGATLNAFDLNLLAVDGESPDTRLTDHREVIAVLMSISVDTQTALIAALDLMGVTLQGRYESVTCLDPDSCAPAQIAGLSLEEGYEVFAGGVKALNEPYSGDGDPDGDGVVNREELANVEARGGSVEDFALAALDETADGTLPSTGCAASGLSNTFGVRAPGDLLTLLILCVFLIRLRPRVSARQRPETGIGKHGIRS